MGDETWYELPLGGGISALDSMMRVQDSFLEYASKARRSDESAIFSCAHHAGTRAPTTTLYFSPALAAFAKECRATPCKRPGEQGLSLLVGNAGARRALFPSPRALEASNGAQG
jgi:hypothetical protein